MAKRDLVTIAEAAQIAGLSRSRIRQIVRTIPGAELRPKEGPAGRWYVPRKWAEDYDSGLGDLRPKVEAAIRKHPDASSSEVARIAGCSASYVRAIRQEQGR